MLRPGSGFCPGIFFCVGDGNIDSFPSFAYSFKCVLFAKPMVSG